MNSLVCKSRLALVALCLAGVFHAFAQAPAGGRPPRGTGSVDDSAVRAALSPRNAEKLGLSVEQRAQLKEISAKARETTKALQEKLRSAIERQAQLMREEKPDEAAVMATIDELFDARKELAKVQTRRVFEVTALLTPEQLKKAAEVVQERRERRRRPPAGPGAVHKREGAGHEPPPPPAEGEKPDED